MTAEGLHSKSAIAAELAYRDREIATLKAEVESLNNINDAMLIQRAGQIDTNNQLKAEVARLIHHCVQLDLMILERHESREDWREMAAGLARFIREFGTDLERANLLAAYEKLKGGK